MFNLKPISQFARKLVPRMRVTYDGDNAFHYISVAMVWLFAGALISLTLQIGPEKINLAQLFETSSIVLSLSGTFWIGAGVIFSPPKKEIRTLDEMKKFISKTFLFASSHVITGTILIFLSNLLLIFSKLDHVIKMH